MYKLQLLILLFSFQFTNITAQVFFSSSEEVIQYLSSDWLLIAECGGFAGIPCNSDGSIPTDGTSYIIFEEISTVTDSIKCSKYEDGIFVQEETAYISALSTPTFDIWQLTFDGPFFVSLNVYIEPYSQQDTLFIRPSCPDCISNIYSRFDSTSNEELVNENKVEIFPNPCKETLNISSQSILNKIVIYDISAKKVLTKYNVDKSVDVSELDSGIYFIEIHMEDKIQKSRFVKT